MECLIWEWTQYCTDIPNLHALMWEIFVGIGIALGIWRMQSKKANARKIHDEEAIVILLGDVRDIAKRFADEILYFHDEEANEKDELEMQQSFQGIFKSYADKIQDIINTSFDVVDNSILDNLRFVKTILEKPMHTSKMDIGQLLMIDNTVWSILYTLNKRRISVIIKKKKWYENQIKTMRSDIDQEYIENSQQLAQSEIKKLSLKPQSDDIIKKIHKEKRDISKTMDKQPSFVDSRGQMYFD